VTAVTDFVSLLFNITDVYHQEGDMGGQRKSLKFVFGIALAIGVVLAMTTWAASPKPQSDSAVAAKAAVYRPALWKVY
jgi:hypothetical protein